MNILLNNPIGQLNLLYLKIGQIQFCSILLWYIEYLGNYQIGELLFVRHLFVKLDFWSIIYMFNNTAVEQEFVE